MVVDKTKMQSTKKFKDAYKDTHTFEQRLDESRRIRAQFPGRIPVVIERALLSGNVADIDKSKFLVPASLTMGQLAFVVRKRLTLSHEHALFVFVGSTLPPTCALLKEVYAQCADRDGFLYATYASENTFGVHV
jgi:GABA(A) receptor-associated protein